MHLLDISMLHGPAVGGVSRYLSTKRRWLRDNTRIRHSQLMAAERAGRGADGEYLLPGVRLPLAGRLRWPVDAPRWIGAIRAMRPDVIEANDMGSSAWFALAAARKLDVPVLGFAHVDLVRFARERKGAIAERVVIEYTRNFYNRCDIVVAPSDYLRRRLESWDVQRVVVRNLGVDGAQFHPRLRTPRLRARLGLPAGTRLLIYAGRFAAEKRIDVLLDTARRLGSPYHLLLVGGGDTPALPGNVTRLPFMADTAALAELMASADALLHAGDVETFGLVYLEAMACGRAVVAARGGAAAEIVDADCGELAQPGDADALAGAVRALYARGIEAAGVAARARFEQHFTLDHSMHRLLALYRTASAAMPSSLPALVAT